MAEIRLEGITKRFGKTEVLKGIDLTIRHGEFFTLVGPSGCGKSTLLHLIAGLEILAPGEVYFDGQPISHLPPKDRDVAVVFQSYALYPHMTVYENMAFPLQMKKMPKSEVDQQVRKVADLLGLRSAISRRPSELSGGQRQRVALGRAIVRQPRVFLLDEPLSNLDAQLRIEMRGEIKKLHQTLGVTMIYVTHDQAEAMTLSDRMAVLHGGTLQQCGTPREVYEQPANLFVAGFIGSPPMNFLKGTLSSGMPRAIHLRNGTDYEVTAEISERLQRARLDGQIILGIRPEHLRLVKMGTEKGWAARVSMVEPMGSELWIELNLADHKVKVKAPADLEVKIGETIAMEIDESKVHFFHADTGLRIP